MKRSVAGAEDRGRGPCSRTLPASVPLGDAKRFCTEGDQLLLGGTVAHSATDKTAHRPMALSTDQSDSNDDYGSETSEELEDSNPLVDDGPDDDFYAFPITDLPKCPYLTGDVQLACRHLRSVEDLIGQQAIELCDEHTYDAFCTVRLFVPLNALADRTKELWDVKEDVFLVVELSRIKRETFRLAEVLPVVRVLHHFTTSTQRSFPIGNHLENIALRFLEKSYRVEDESLMNAAAHGSFFERVHKLLSERLCDLTDFCVNCDERLPSGGILPSICKKEFCVFQYDEIGLYSDVASLAVTADVLDLLLTLFMAAVTAQDVALMLNPWPLIRDPHDESLLVYGDNPQYVLKLSDHDKAAADEQKLQGNLQTVEEFVASPELNEYQYTDPGDYRENWVQWVRWMLPVDRIKQHLRNMPSAHQLTNPTFYAKFRKENLCQAKLVTWTISSNSAYLLRLPKSHQITMMNTDFQFLTVADSPAKHQRFTQLKATSSENSIFVFHGSPIQNWHSILRNGLIVASDTPYMRNGAAYGKGIYFSPDRNVSFQYSSSRGSSYGTTLPRWGRAGRGSYGSADGAPRASTRDCTVAISICEILDEPSVLTKRGDIWVLSDPDYCCVRLLFLYDTSARHVGPVKLTDEAIAQIFRAIELFSYGDFDARMSAFTDDKAVK